MSFPLVLVLVREKRALLTFSTSFSTFSKSYSEIKGKIKGLIANLPQVLFEPFL
jgi:hypothetical protein